MRRFFTSAGTLSLVIAMMAAPKLSSAQSAAGWPTFHGGPGRDGSANVSGPTTATELNRFTLNGTVNGAPVIDSSGRVYIGDMSGTLYAFDTRTNAAAPIWTYSTGSPIEAAPGLSPDGSTVYVGSDDGTVTAVATATGAKRWTITVGTVPSAIHSSPVVSSDGSTLFLASVTGTVEAVSATTGVTQWSIHLNGNTIPGSISVGQDGSVVYVASYSLGIVFAIPATGAQAGQSSAPCYLDGPANGSPAVDSNGNVYAVSSRGTLFSFNPGCGGERWHVGPATPSLSTSTPAISNGLVVVGNANGYVYGISASNGTQQWQLPTGGNVAASAAIATGNGEIYIGSGSGKLYALSSTGQLTWARGLGASVGSPALAPDGSVWVASQDGTLFHIGNLSLPPPVANTATPGPSATAGPTSTALPPTTAPTASVVPLTITLLPQVAGGHKQTITVHSAPNTAVKLLVNYPNGSHHTGHVTTDASGNAVHHYTQPASAILHNKFTATVTATAGTGTTLNTQTATYKIRFAPIDASAEPRSQKVGGKVQIYVHAKAGMHVRATLVFPNHKTKTFNQTAGPKGFGHWSYKVGRGLTKGSNHTVTVNATTVGQHPNHTTKTTFTIT